MVAKMRSRSGSIQDLDAYFAALVMNQGREQTLTFFVGVDGSEASHQAVDLVMKYSMPKSKNRMVVAHVYDESKTYLPRPMQQAVLLAEMENRLITSFPAARYELKWTAKRPEHGIKEELVHSANETMADFVVVGFYGRKGRKVDHSIGSSADYSMRNASASSIVVKDTSPLMRDIAEERFDGNHPRPIKFLVGIDNSNAALKALQDVMKLSKSLQDPIVMVHIAPQEQEDLPIGCTKDAILDKFENIRKRFLAQRPNVTIRIVMNTPGQTLSEHILEEVDKEEADFVALGADAMKAKAKGKNAYYLGSISDHCVKQATCNVIVSHSA